MTITSGTLCSGIGAPEVAARTLGWESLFASEIASAARRILAQRFGFGVGNGPRLFGDFTAAPLNDFPSVDVMIAGTPCQAFSVAGARLSLADARGNLTLAALGVVHELAARPGRPLRNYVWENVPGCLNTVDNAFGCFLAALVGADAPICPPGAEWGLITKADAGPVPDDADDADDGRAARAGTYGWKSARFPRVGMVSGPRGRAAWRVFNSQYFGLAQRRERVFLVADFGNGADPAAVLFEPQGGVGDFVPRRAEGEDAGPFAYGRAAIGGSFGDSETLLSGGRGRPGDELGGLIASPRDSGTLGASAGRGHTQLDGVGAIIPELAYALQERDAKGADSNTKPGHFIVNEVRAPAPGDALAFKMRGRDGENMPEAMPGGVSPALSTDGGGSSLPFVAAFNGRQDPVGYGNLAVPLDCDPLSICARIGYVVRRLTPVECCRLQGFADDHTAGESFTQQYSTLGNAMSVPVILWVLARIDAQLRA